MFFTFEEFVQLRESITVIAQTKVDQRQEFPKLDKTLMAIEKSLVQEAMRKGASSTEAKGRVAEAVDGKLKRPTNQAAEHNERLKTILKRATDRAFERDPQGTEDPPTLPPERTHVAPQLGIWTFRHSLVLVECRVETPPTTGKDDMLYSGTFTYKGPGGLAPYYNEFDAGDVDHPGHTLASVPVQPGTHSYSAKHLVAEEDVFSTDTAKLVSISITLLLDLLIEAGILVGRAVLKAWLNDNTPAANTDAEKALKEKAIDKALDELEGIAREAGEDLLGILAEMLAAALGPEVFPIMTSEATITWNWPNLPQVSSIRVIGSGTVAGKPRGFTGAGASLVLGIPLTRSGGGSYQHAMLFAMQGQNNMPGIG